MRCCRKYLIYALLVGACCPLLRAQDALRVFPVQTQNLIPGNDAGQSYVSRAHVIDRDGDHLDAANLVKETEYYDGLGRLMRKVRTGNSMSKEVVAVTREYDSRGRVTREWLPVEVASGSGASVELQTTATAYYGDEGGYAFTRTTHPEQVSGGIVTVHTPGQAWQSGAGRTVENYIYNPGDYRMYHLDESDNMVGGDGWYAAGELMATEAVDEDGNRAIEVKDGTGATVRTVSYPDASTAVITDYVYDLRGRLRYVLVPGADEALATYPDGKLPSTWRARVDNLAYEFTYDAHGRMIGRKYPGREREEFVYDIQDKVLYARDGNLRAAGRWRWYLYDGLGRPVGNGLITNSASRDSLQRHIGDIEYTYACFDNENGDSFEARIPGGYVYTRLPASADTVICRLDYYDTYDFLKYYQHHADSLAYEGRQGFSAALPCDDGTGVRPPVELLAGSVVFDSNGLNPEVTAIYYDAEGRVVQTRRANHMKGYDSEYLSLRDDGVVLRRLHLHSAEPKFGISNRLHISKLCHTDLYEYTYNSCGAPVDVTLSHDGGDPVALDHTVYTGIGQRRYFYHYSAKSGQTCRYNVRGEMEWIGGSQFSHEVFRDRRQDGSVGLLSGRIASSYWRTWENTGLTIRNYDFTYDGAGRLTQATYKDLSETGARGDVELVNAPDYSVTYSYDRLSNITDIKRMGLADRQTLADGSQRWRYGTVHTFGYKYDGVLRLSGLPGPIRDAYPLRAIEAPSIPDLPVLKPVEYLYDYDANGNIVSSGDPVLSYLSYDFNNRLVKAESRVEDETGTAVYGQGQLSGADGTPRGAVYYIDAEPHWFRSANYAGGSLFGPVRPATSPVKASISAGDIIGDLKPVTRSITTKAVYYCGDYRYEWSDADQSVKTVLSLPQGYLDADGWHFYLHDCQGNVRSIVRANGAVEEFYHYYPYGELTAESSYSSITSRRYGDKESSTYTGTTISDHGARPYLPSFPGFSTQDPLGHTTPAVTPYLYCGADPINRTDPTGLNYLVTIDMENNTITISATYHTYEKFSKGLMKGLKFWNNLSGRMVNGWQIVFNLQMEKHPDSKPANTNTIRDYTDGEKQYESNGYVEGSITGKAGTTKKGYIIKVSPENKTFYTEAHEIGHTLGLIHPKEDEPGFTRGVMTKTDENRTSAVTDTELSVMIGRSLSGNPQIDDRGAVAGRGTAVFLNTDAVEDSELLKLKKQFPE